VTGPDAIAERWRRAHEAACAFAPDREAVAVIHLESSAVVEAALAVAGRGAPGASLDLSDFAQRELVQLVVARAHRMAAIGMTPAAAVAYVPALAEALGERFLPRLEGLVPVVVESYVRGLAEQQVTRAQEMLAEQTPVVALAPGVVACFLTGDPEAERVTRVVERLEQAALRSDAKVILVDLGHLALDDPDRLRAALTADEGARMLGAACVFTGVDTRVEKALREAGVAMERLTTAPTVAEALDRARKRGLWKRLFE